MKKILTILLAVGTVTMSQAQSSRNHSHEDRTKDRYAKEVAYEPSWKNNRDRYDNRYDHNNHTFTAQERDAQIRAIRENYGRRIAAVKRDRDLKRRAINEQIRDLERQRDARIREVEAKYASNVNRPYDRYGTNDRSQRRW